MADSNIYISIPGKAEYKADLLKIYTIIKSIEINDLKIVHYIPEFETKEGELAYRSLTNVLNKVSN